MSAKNLDILAHIQRLYKIMWELEKATLITNNDYVEQAYRDVTNVKFIEGYRDVLIAVRDMVYDRHVLLTHPQASSLKPNQTPYRSVFVYPQGEEGNMDSIMMIDKCIQVFDEWQEISPSPESYEEKVEHDFKIIDKSVIDNIIDRFT